MNNTEDGLNKRKGYLHQDYLFFHLRDQESQTFSMHYHDFHKLILFIEGSVTYCIEGKYYHLRPGDLLLVPNNALHKPLIHHEQPYERIVLWLNPHLHIVSEDCMQCFYTSCDQSHLLRLNTKNQKYFRHLLEQLETSQKDNLFAHKLLETVHLTQLLIWLNRYILEANHSVTSPDIFYHPRITQLIDYININLEKPLPISELATTFYLSKHYLMHFFKTETGYSLHQYIQKKRLIKASHLLQDGISPSEVYISCGFTDYSQFARAFKKEFHTTPKAYLLQYKN